ncbi:cell division protein ZapE [Microbacterium sp. NPDC096154]|uniref:cell division protein ZapE n=1 Tax=Microbacterium sp. NPDC096154 TaxID=3155549 RepID=UPI00331DB708
METMPGAAHRARPAQGPRPPFRGVTRRAFADAAARAGIALDDAQHDAVSRILSPARAHLYLHGPAGRGKTWLMDTAYGAARTRRKRRLHFHDFFPALHAAIFRHRHDLEAALDELLESEDGRPVELLCFDEFHVHDVADGVLVRRLLDALFARGTAMVVTSNYAPEQLLPHPLFHGTFEPAIADIRRRFDVIRVDGGRDHRERSTRTAHGFARGVWIAGSREPAAVTETTVRCGERDVTVRGVDADILHATFADLCERPLGAADYARLAELRPSWRVTEVPPLDELTGSAAQRLANLVDIAADRGVRIEFHAAGRFERLADAPVPPLDLPRTLSRLRSLRQEERP